MYFPPYVDASGPHIPTYEDRLEQLISDYRVIFGADLYLGEDTADYQILSIFAKALDDLTSLMLLSFSSTDPNYASGQALDLLLPLFGLTRSKGESDADARLRLSHTLTGSASSTLTAMESALRAVPKVKDVKILENDTDTEVNGIPAHGIKVIVKNGGATEIAKAIMAHKPAGVSTVGSVSSTVTDPFGNPHVVRFSRSVDMPVQLTVRIQTLSGYDAATTDPILKKTAADYINAMKIGQPLMISFLMAELAKQDDPEHPTFGVSSVTVATSRGSSSVMITPNPDEVLWTDPAMISINKLS